MDNPITKAALILGSKAALARSIGVSSPTIQELEASIFDKPPPIKRCVQIERVTLSAVMRWDLRPHDWYEIWPELVSHPNAPLVPSISVSSTPGGLVPGPCGLGSFSGEVKCV